MKMYRCLFPNCSELLASSGYCPRHLQYKPQHKPFEHAKRSNQELYRTREWKELRAEVLKEMPNCCKCGTDKNLTVHHITPPRGNPELFFSRSNLVTICVDCHRLITAKEIQDRQQPNR